METARRLGLVSKRFRQIAEPFEFQAIAVTGLQQLQGLVTRLKNASARECIRIEHMFLCDLTKDLALDTESNREAFRSSNMPSFVEQARKNAQKGARNRWIAPMVRKAEILMRVYTLVIVFLRCCGFEGILDR